MHDNKFDHKVRSKFENFSPPVPVDLWNKIEGQLDADGMNKVKSVRKAWVLLYAAVAATVLIAFAFWRFGDVKEIKPNEDLEVHISRIPVEIGESQQERNQEMSSYSKESVLNPDPPKVVKSSMRASGKVKLKPQTEEKVDLISAKTNVEPSIKQENQPIAYVESTYSVSTAPFSELPTLVEKELPSIDTDLIVQESNIMHDETLDDFIDEIDKPKNKRLGVSTILNLIAKGFVNENGNPIEFSQSDEGILKLDIKRGWAKSKD